MTTRILGDIPSHHTTHEVGGSDFICDYNLSDDVLISSVDGDSEQNTLLGSPYRKVKESVYHGAGGIIRFVYDYAQNEHIDAPSYFRLYVNGNARGTEKVLTYNATYQSWSENISGIVDGDLIQLYGYTDNPAGSCGSKFRNLRVLGYTVIHPSMLSQDP